VSEPCFFTIRGRHRWGLSLHLGITTRQYSALLLACDLVSTSKATNGASSVSCSETVWREDFLKRYGLLFVDTKGHCEITRAKVRYKYLEDDDGRSIRPTTKTADTMHLLRIGKYKDRGETVTAIRQIHSDQPPASFNNKQRTAQRRLFNDIRDDFSKYLFDNRIDDVMSWVEMTDVFNPTNTDEEDDDDSSDSSDEMEEKIPTVKDDDDIEKKPPAVKDGGNNEKKPPAVKDPTEIAMKLIMESMGYSPDSCHPEVVNKLKDVMKVHKELQEVVKKHPPTLQQCPRKVST